MKKAQAVKFWTALHENTSVKETISAFTNKKGYDGKATLRRYAEADAGFRGGQSSQAVAGKGGWSPEYVNKIRGWWEGEFLSRTVTPLVSDFDTQKHRDTIIKAVIPELDIDVFPPRDFDLAIFWSRPNEPHWPISKGRIKRQNGEFLVQLTAEDQLELAYLRQHLIQDPIWDAIDGWKQAMVGDIIARFWLLDKIAAETRSRIRLRVVGDLAGSGNDKDALGLYYAYTIYDQVFSRAVGISLAPKCMGDFTFESPRITRLGQYIVVRSHNLSLHTLAISYLLEAQVSLVELTETRAARAAYEEVLSRRASVRKHSDRIRLAVAFPEGSTCDGCSRWVTAPE